MSDNSKLLNEIYKEKEIEKSWFFPASFKNKHDEDEFSQFKEDNLKKTRLFAGLIINIFCITHSLFFYIEKYALYAFIFHIIVNLINISFLVLIHKAKINSKLSINLCNIRFLFNIVNYIHYIVYLGVNINNNEYLETKEA